MLYGVEDERMETGTWRTTKRTTVEGYRRLNRVCSIQSIVRHWNWIFKHRSSVRPTEERGFISRCMDLTRRGSYVYICICTYVIKWNKAPEAKLRGIEMLCDRTCGQSSIFMSEKFLKNLKFLWRIFTLGNFQEIEFSWRNSDVRKIELLREIHKSWIVYSKIHESLDRLW